MSDRCKQCGSKMVYSPKNHGDLCTSCGKVIPLEQQLFFEKKPFSENVELTKDIFDNQKRTVRCSACGATMVVDKLQAMPECSYCGATTLVESEHQKLMYIDSIIPFEYDKAEACNILRKKIHGSFYAKKSVLKDLTEKNLNGVYVNAFVYEWDTSSHYDGVLSYTTTHTDKDGHTHTTTHYRNVSGVWNEHFPNITIEANSYLNQYQLQSVMPFDYNQANKFDQRYTYGYCLEYQDKLFDDCKDMAEDYVESAVKKAILRHYSCDDIVKMNLSTTYSNQKYNYILLPIYFVNTKVKDKNYKLLINGQTGKCGQIPKNPLKIILTILLVLGLIGLIIWLVYSAG